MKEIIRLLIETNAVLPDTRAHADKSSYPVGSEINIDCTVRGHPQPEVTWLKDGVLLEQSDRLQISSKTKKKIRNY